MARLWDISPPVREGSPVFPGDTPYRQRWAASIAPGCPVNVSELTLSPHVGAHAGCDGVLDRRRVIGGAVARRAISGFDIDDR